MASRSYRVELILRAACFCATAYLFFFLLFQSRFALTTALVGLASLLQGALLCASVDRRNRTLARFLEAVRNEDFTGSPSFPGGRSFDALKAEYALAIDAMRRRKLEGERQRRYIETIAESAGIGFAVFDSGGRAEFANEAFRALLGRPVPRDIFELGDLGGALRERVTAMRNGEKASVSVERGGERLQLLLAVRDFVLLQDRYRLLSLQNIGSELEAKEMDAQAGLARVLMHEIMNSIAPISSLAFSATAILSKVLKREGEGPVEDAMSALETIGKRSRSLLAFVENYRKVLKVPTPAFAAVRCDELLDKLRGLMEASLRERRIALELRVSPSGLRLQADEGLIEQALINLMRNSIEALEGANGPAIEISARLEPGGRPVIEVADNGRGIAEGNLEKVFIPFFTTKSEGSGVGLSLCRQIMRLHGGSISVSSAPGERTVVRLRF
jgi:signal transduction histidine kinase